MSIKHIVKDVDIHLQATLRIVGHEEPFYGPGRLQLMQQIERTGSINQAAKNMGMSYKKAWKMINSMNDQAVTPLIITQTGGNSGGGASITAEGREVMQYFEALNQRFQNFLDEETKKMKS